MIFIQFALIIIIKTNKIYLISFYEIIRVTYLLTITYLVEKFIQNKFSCKGQISYICLHSCDFELSCLQTHPVARFRPQTDRQTFLADLVNKLIQIYILGSMAVYLISNHQSSITYILFQIINLKGHM